MALANTEETRKATYPAIYKTLNRRAPTLSKFSIEFILTYLENIYSHNDPSQIGLIINYNEVGLLFSSEPFANQLETKRDKFPYKQFAKLLKYKEFRSGDKIFCKGQKKTELYLLLKGCILKTNYIYEASSISCRKNIHPGTFFGASWQDQKDLDTLDMDEKFNEYDYIASKNCKCLYLDKESMQHVISHSNLLDNHEDCHFLLNFTKYFSRFNCNETVKQNFITEVAPLLNRIYVKKGQCIIKHCEDINSLYIIREGSLKVLFLENTIEDQPSRI